jgi:RNA polymerase sigma-70 factor (ECF subfamily)
MWKWGRRPFEDKDQAAIAAQIGALRRFAIGLCHDVALADDLVQDCLERAVSRWHLRQEDRSLKAWLFTILYHAFINERRRSVRRDASVSLDDLPIDPAIAADQEERLRVADILAAIDRLQPDHRALLLLIGVEEVSYAEASEILQIPIGTVMSRLSRAREALRKQLESLN